MAAPAVQGIDLFKIAGRSISGWILSLRTGPGHVRQPFCSHLEERLLLYLEYHPQVACYARGDIGAQFATLQEVWPYGEVACVQEVGSRLGQRWSTSLVEAAIWKMVADAATPFPETGERV